MFDKYKDSFLIGELLWNFQDFESYESKSVRVYTHTHTQSFNSRLTYCIMPCVHISLLYTTFLMNCLISVCVCLLFVTNAYNIEITQM